MSFMSTVLLGGLLLSGNEPETKHFNRQKLVDEVRKSISYPIGIQTANTKELVLVSFSLEPCGTIKIHEMNYSNADFRDYVVEELQKLDLNTDFPQDEICHIRFSFVKE